MTDAKVELVARAIVTARGGDPDMCVYGFSWQAGELGRTEAGSVCYRSAWEDRVAEAQAAITALEQSDAVLPGEQSE